MPDESLMVAWRAAEAAAGGPEVIEKPAEVATAPEVAEADAAAKEAAPAAKDEPGKVAKADKAAAVAATGDAAELEQLKTLATKLNFKIEGDRVSVAERVALRAEKREAKARAAQLEQELGVKVGEARKELDPMFAAKRAWAEKDLDGFAKALGHNDWNALQKDALDHFSDPNHKVIQELKRKDREREERDQRDAEAQRQTVAHRQKLEAVSEYKRGLSQEMAGSEDPLIKAMADDPMFVDVVHAIQEEHYDRSSDSTCTPEEAVELATRGAKQPFRKELQALYQKLHAAFGGGEATAVGATKKTGKTGAARREAELPHVAKPGGNGYMDPKDRDYWAQQLKASQD